MAEHVFGFGKGKMSDERRRTVEEIARRHRVELTYAETPEDEVPRYWFAGPGRGAPADSKTELAVTNDLTAAGLVIHDLADE